MALCNQSLASERWVPRTEFPCVIPLVKKGFVPCPPPFRVRFGRNPRTGPSASSRTRRPGVLSGGLVPSSQTPRSRASPATRAKTRFVHRVCPGRISKTKFHQLITMVSAGRVVPIGQGAATQYRVIGRTEGMARGKTGTEAPGDSGGLGVWSHAAQCRGRTNFRCLLGVCSTCVSCRSPSLPRGAGGAGAPGLLRYLPSLMRRKSPESRRSTARPPSPLDAGAATSLAQKPRCQNDPEEMSQDWRLPVLRCMADLSRDLLGGDHRHRVGAG